MANQYSGSDSGKGGLEVTEVDGSPNVFGVTKIVVSNTTLSDDGNGTVTIDTTGSGGSPGGSDTQVQYNDGSSFGGVSGATTDGTTVTVTAGNLEVVDISDSSGNKFIAPSDSGLTVGVGTGSGNATISSSGSHNLTIETGNATTGSITITDGSAGAISLTPNTTGKVVVGSGGSAATITSSGAYDLVLDTNSGTTTGSITITDGADGNISMAPNGSGEISVGSGSASGKISSSGAYDLVLDTNSGTNSGSITITDAADGDISLVPNGSGDTAIGGSTPTLTTTAGNLILNTAGSATSTSITLNAGDNGAIGYDANGTGSHIFRIGLKTVATGVDNTSESAGSVGFKSIGLIETISSTPRVLSEVDTGTIFYTTVSSASFTVFDAGADDVGVQYVMINNSGGTILINVATNSQTLNGDAVNYTIADEKAATLVCVDTDTWWLFGDVTTTG